MAIALHRRLLVAPAHLHLTTQPRRHTVYVGMSTNLRQRQMTYALNGSHIAEYIEAALRRGNVLWRRLYTLPTALQAQQEEMRCHTVLDYPWNRQQNPRSTRIVYTRKSNGLLGGKVSWLCGAAQLALFIAWKAAHIRICRWHELICRSTCMSPM